MVLSHSPVHQTEAPSLVSHHYSYDQDTVLSQNLSSLSSMNSLSSHFVLPHLIPFSCCNHSGYVFALILGATESLQILLLLPIVCLPLFFSSVAQSCPTLQPHGLQYARPPWLSPTPRVYPNSRPSSQ